MNRGEVVPYEQLVGSMHAKLESLGPYEQADCTGEFNALCTEFFGGTIFGENAIAKCGNSSDGPAVYFYDRVFEGNSTYPRPPLQVAALNKDGFHVAQDVVLVDWLSAREVRDDGTYAYAGPRAGVANSPFSLAEIDRSTLEAITSRLATARIAARVGIFATEHQITAVKRSIARIAATIGDHPDAADIAEVVGTENQVMPHVLRSPAGSSAMYTLSNGYNRDLDCYMDGIWAAIAPGRQVIRDEVFVARDNHRDEAIDTIESNFWGLSGQRILMAVGRSFDSDEKERALAKGRRADAASKRSMGQHYGTPYSIDASALPHGVLARGRIFDTNYRVFVPQATQR